jgi:hypothetical protein
VGVSSTDVGVQSIEDNEDRLYLFEPIVDFLEGIFIIDTEGLLNRNVVAVRYLIVPVVTQSAPWLLNPALFSMSK